MKRNIILYISLLRVGFSTLLAYRVNFINSVVSSMFFCILTISAMMLLTTRTSSVFGWTRYELWLLTGIYNMIFGIFYTLFAYNFDDLARIVNKGELDAWLLKPIDTQFGISIWRVQYASLFRSVISIGYIFYLFFLLKLTASFLTIFLFTVSIVFSILLMYSVSFLVMTLLIWFSNLNNLSEMLYTINGITRYPREMYQRTGPLLFAILFPLTLVVIVPTRIILGKASLTEIVSLMIISSLAFLLSRKFFHFALRFYTSASG